MKSVRIHERAKELETKCSHYAKNVAIEEVIDEKILFCPYCGAYLGNMDEIESFDDLFNTLNGLQKNLVYELVSRALKEDPENPTSTADETKNIEQ